MRERLSELHDPSGQTLYCFTAQFECYSKTDNGSNVALLVSVKHDGRFACDHSWIHRSKAMKLLELRHGDIVQFVACVERYPKNVPVPLAEVVEYDYCFSKIREMIIISRRNDV